MPRGASPKREREYNELKHKFEKSGRYKGREEEVASRIVNKQRAQYGETKGGKAQERKGKSPDRNLPIDGYQHLTSDEVGRKLSGCSHAQLEQIKHYEGGHKDRKTVLRQIDRQLHGK
jgi:hypothetical protein